jgi:hypothetical protein
VVALHPCELFHEEHSGRIGREVFERFESLVGSSAQRRAVRFLRHHSGAVLRLFAEHGMRRRGLGRDRDEVLSNGGAHSCWVGTCASPPQRGMVSPDCRDSCGAGIGLWNRTIVRITCEAARQGRGSPPVLGPEKRSESFH